MTPEAVRTAGLSGDLGWDEANEAGSGLTTALLLLASGAVWGSAWVLSGLPPLLAVATGVARGRKKAVERGVSGEAPWRSQLV